MRRGRRAARRSHRHLSVESLENRRVLATFVVDTVVDIDPQTSFCAASPSPGNGTCSIRGAIAAAESNPGADRIEIPAGTYNLDPNFGSFDLDSDQNIDFIGVGNGPEDVVIDGGGVSRGFDIFGSGVPSIVTMQNFTIQNTVANDGSGGGAINSFGSASLVLQNMVLQDNRADDNAQFPGFSSSGGAIQAGVDVTIEDSILRRNTATGSGGAVDFSTTDQPRTLTIRNSTIEDNVTGDSDTDFGLGGGVNVSGFNSALILDTVDVDNNMAGDSGGGIYFEGSSITVTDSNFTSNQALGSDSGGGGLYIIGDGLSSFSFDVSGGQFESNTAVAGAGGLEAVDYSGTIDGTSFLQNQVLGQGDQFDQGGGAVALLADPNSNRTVTIRNTDIRQNQAPTAAGIAAVNIDLTLEDSVLDGNQTTAGQSPGAGAIGAVSNSLTQQMTINTSTIINNTSITEAGGIGAIDIDLVINDSTISSNTASGGRAGGIGLLGNLRNPILTASAVTIANNQSGSDGGGIAFDNAGFDLTNVTITGNQSGLQGGGIAVGTSAPGVQHSILFSTVAENQAISSGSNIAAQGEPISIAASIFSGGDGFALPGTFVSLGGNLDSGQSMGFNDPSDFNNTDPLLGPLQDNGGPVFTRELAAQSPAIDAARNTQVLVDARGTVRPQDGDGDNQAFPDIGAFERLAVPPVIVTAVDDAVSIDEDDPLTFIDVLANDLPTGTLTVIAVTAASLGDVTIAAGGSGLNYLPNLNEFGLDVFTYTVSNGAGQTASATVRVDVIAINDPPIAGNDVVDVATRQAFTIQETDLLSNDFVGAANESNQTLSILDLPATTVAGATISFVGGIITITPDPGFVGLSDSFTYTLSDGIDTDTGTVVLNFSTRVGGHVYCDANGNGSEDSGEAVVGGRVFIDADGDRSFDIGERETQTDLMGDYFFTGLVNGQAVIVAEVPASCQTIPDNPGVIRSQLDAGLLARSITAADVDGDGDLEMVVASDLSGTLSVIDVVGGNLSLLREITLDNRPQSVFAYPPASANSLAAPLIAVAAIGVPSEGGQVYFGNSSYESFPIAAGAIDVAVDDFGDGLPTVVAASFRESSLTLFAPDGRFAPQELSVDASQISSIATGDVDGDGDNDIVVVGIGYDTTFESGASSGDSVSEISILLNNGDGSFSPLEDGESDANLTSKYVDVMLADIDGDGQSEILALDQRQTLRVLRLDSGQVRLVSSTAVTAKASKLAVGDFNRDSQLDVVVASNSNDLIEIFVGDDGGNFSLVKSIQGVFNPIDISVADFDQDGVDEIAVANLYRRSVAGNTPDPLLPSTVTVLKLQVAEESIVVDQSSVSVDYTFPRVVPGFSVSSRMDVNASGEVTANDALVIINQLNRQSTAEGESLAGETLAGETLARVRAATDINLDGATSPLDALLIINHLNENRDQSAEDHQGEQSLWFATDDDANERTAAVDDLFAAGLF
ncbi:thrombospondin type 3 repeat family [Rhodopirellula maiorica SM1]|uniref:Thrombospondin type 3 repeat family n=1 Tax=Rhodopirellula maiorica SM1 TaxID=1265738 RepID=M5RA68_9BACT|nr:thrombospondin type 3 repeat family [Rhodopirellula maiorica SM1]